MTLHIKELFIEAIVGLLPHERLKEQPLRLDVSIEYCYENGRYIDYAKLAVWLEKLLIRRRYRVLEEAAQEIADRIKERHENVESVKIILTKPEAIANGIASVELHKFF